MRSAILKLSSLATAGLLLLAATCWLNCWATQAPVAGAAPQPMEHSGCPDSPAGPEAPSKQDCGRHVGTDFALKLLKVPSHTNAQAALATTPSPQEGSTPAIGSVAEADERAPVSPLKPQVSLRI